MATGRSRLGREIPRVVGLQTAAMDQNLGKSSLLEARLRCRELVEQAVKVFFVAWRAVSGRSGARGGGPDHPDGGSAVDDLPTRCARTVFTRERFRIQWHFNGGDQERFRTYTRTRGMQVTAFDTECILTGGHPDPGAKRRYVRLLYSRTCLLYRLAVGVRIALYQWTSSDTDSAIIHV